MPRSASCISNSMPGWILLLGSVLLQMPTASGMAQLAPNSTPLVTPVQLKPVSLVHCYWHFLMYQNHLDLRAAEQTAQGKTGGLLSSHLQAKLGLSDADFAPIRSSSNRLAAEVNALNAKAAAIVAAKSPKAGAQLQALKAEREVDINAEVAYIRGALGPVKTGAFETFIVQMFSPKTAAVQLTAPPPTPATTGVQP